MKLRLLNGSHQAMAYKGLLRGHTYVHEATADQVVVDLVERYIGEAAETLRPVDGIDVPAYRAELMARFGNPKVRDTLERLATRRERPRSDVPVAGRAGACPRRAGLASRGGGDRGMGRAFVAGTAGERRVGRSSGKPGHRRPRECRHRPAGFLDEDDWFGGLAADAVFVADFARAFREYRRAARGLSHGTPAAVVGVSVARDDGTLWPDVGPVSRAAARRVLCRLKRAKRGCCSAR